MTMRLVALKMTEIEVKILDQLIEAGYAQSRSDFLLQAFKMALEMYRLKPGTRSEMQRQRIGHEGRRMKGKGWMKKGVKRPPPDIQCQLIEFPDEAY